MKKIQPTLVKELRQRTGAGFLDCQKALIETESHLEEAVELLRQLGYNIAAKKSTRVAAEGCVCVECDDHHQTAVMVEINSETDFMAKDPEFREFCDTVVQALIAREAFQDIDVLRQAFEGERTALVARTGENLHIRRLAHVAGEKVVTYSHGGGRIGVIVSAKGAGELAALRQVAMHIAAMNPVALMPEEITEQQLQACGASAEGAQRSALALHSQALITAPSLTVGQFLEQSRLSVKAFYRFELGAGIEKPIVDFASEVQAAKQ